jgi:hypothetical protein
MRDTGRSCESRIVGIRDRIDVADFRAGADETDPYGALGQLPGRERIAILAVLPPREPLLLLRRGDDDAAVDDIRGSGVVKDRVDPEHDGHPTSSTAASGSFARRWP